ncbi:MAG TPA: DsbA family oxidoreductase [Solirubrobacteraceae bacterium]|nr:DsbA family oxidoreductase [Solirubrobacteraceae bacterium]
MDVEIWSDIACPWCYIGKRRFEAALAQFDHRDDVRVTWRSFELDPSAPHEREGDNATRLAEKYGITVDRAKEMGRTVTDAAAGEGLDFHLETQRSGTTFDGHRVIHLAAEHALQDAMKERLLHAYFTEGQLMSDHDTLVRLAVEVGLDDDEVRQMLASDRFADEVRGDERMAGQFGISAVPTFVVDRAIGASGAHPPEALLQLLHQGWERRAPVSVIAGGESCDVDGNC